MSAAAVAATAAAMKAAAAARSKRGGKGKAARRNATRNASHVLDYLETLEGATRRDDMESYMETNGIQLARVTRQCGMGRLRVTLQDGTPEVDVSVAGSLRFKGRSSTKTDRPSCMCVNDLVVLYGSQAAGKIPRELWGHIQAGFERLDMGYPSDFFAKPGAETGADAAEMGYEWEADEEAVTATLTAAATGKPVAAGKAKGKDKVKSAAAAADDDDFDVTDI